MSEDLQQIADDLHSLHKAMESLSARIISNGLGPDDVRSKLGDYSVVLLSLRSRVLALPNQQSSIVAEAPQENQQ
jgi:hypothetical protein